MQNKLLKFFIILIFGCLTINSYAQKKMTVLADRKFKTQAITDLQSRCDEYRKIALQIWEYAELGYQESKSSALLKRTLADNGFSVQSGVAEIPTAFIATYGSGKPIIGILAEFDALPGLSQDTVPEKKSLGKVAGHACGHHLFGTASMAAAIELKKIIDQNHLSGTIKLFGTPAEEGGSGKVYLVRAGMFKDVDVVIHWHPATVNAVSYSTTLAAISAKFRFHGISAHASMAPDKGRSSLDAVEGMDYMVNMMREHIPSDARIHYIITDGGKAPNVVPDFAESYYVVRHNNRDTDKQIFERVVKAAEGAALGTGTSFDYEIISGSYDILPNKTLTIAMQKDLELVGGVNYSQKEIEFGNKIQATFNYKSPSIESASKVEPLSEAIEKEWASSDVGDVSWNVPTVGLRAATWIPGTTAHSWQAVACGGTEIGVKGMIVAAKTMTLMGIDLLNDRELVSRAREEFNKDRGEGFEYKALLGDRKPPLDYRN